jgi:hypothetical protein
MKHFTPETDQDDIDAALLYDKIDRLAPLVKKYVKKMDAACEFGVSDATLTETRHDMLDLLFSFADDPEWLARCKAFHTEDKTGFTVRKRAYKAGK